MKKLFSIVSAPTFRPAPRSLTTLESENQMPFLEVSRGNIMLSLGKKNKIVI